MGGERTYLQCNGGRWRLSCQRHLTVIESDKNVPFSFHLEEHKVSHLNMKNWLSRYWTNYNATKMKSHKPYSKMVANLWLFFFLHDNWPSKSPFKVKVLLNSADAIEAKRFHQWNKYKRNETFPLRCMEQQNAQCSFVRRCIKMNGLSTDDVEI